MALGTVGTVVVPVGVGVGIWAAGVAVMNGVAGSVVGIKRGPWDGVNDPPCARDGEGVSDILWAAVDQIDGGTLQRWAEGRREIIGLMK